MEKKLYITKIPVYPDIVFAALVHDNRLMRLFPVKQGGSSKRNNIYVGKVHAIAKNINAAFIDIGEEELYFLNMEEAENALFVSEHKGGIKPGDEFLVQVDKEATKAKKPVVKTEFSISGKYAVVFSTHGNIRYSAKLTGEEKIRIAKALGEKSFPYEVTIRTNAGICADAEAIRLEMEKLADTLASVIKKASFSKPKTLVYRADAGLNAVVNDLYDDQYDEILTDLEEIYQEKEGLFGSRSGCVRFYQDKLLPLYKLCRLEKEIKDALSEKVYLKSGGYLIWQDTEALTAVDINTGQFCKGKDKEKTFFKLNMEAAAEIARQIQLRNTSGIIIVDLINMKDAEAEKQVFETFASEMSKISNAPHVVDITKLGLLEMTRKKQDKPLKQLLTVWK